jgi:hypothetical protein
MVVLLRRCPGGWRPWLEFSNLPAGEAALLRIAARIAQGGRNAEVVGALLLVEGRPAFALTVTAEWPSSSPSPRRDRLSRPCPLSAERR